MIVMTSLMIPEQIQSAQYLEAASIDITLASIGWAMIVLLVAFIADVMTNRITERAVERRGGVDDHVTATLKKTSSYVIYSIALVLVLGAFVPLSALGAAVGLIGLGISFALREMIANFISGVMILLHRPFKIGDQIEAEGEQGTVDDIRIRATDVKTFDGRKVMIPNSKLYNDTVINNTAYENRRFDVVVGIGYDEDIQEAKTLAGEALNESETIEEDPAPQVVVEELGDSSVGIKLRGWTSSRRAGIVKASSEVTQKVKEKYDENGIDIPYPIRTVYMEE